jgi:deazaflavin-dependent oxidoreductase (nitroreductase family)
MWYNPIMMWILRSPLHSLLSGNTMIITYTGRKSAKTFSTPVNYVRDGDVLWTVSFRHRTWWRNLSDSPVTVRIQGKDVSGVAKSITDQKEVTADLMAYLQKTPHIAKYLDVRLDANGQPQSKDVAQAAQTRVMIRVQLPSGLSE